MNPFFCLLLSLSEALLIKVNIIMSKHVDLDPSRARASELEQKERDQEIERKNEGLSLGLGLHEGTSQSAIANEAAQNHANEATSKATERNSININDTIDELIQGRGHHEQIEEPTDSTQTQEEHDDPGEALHVQIVRESALEAKRHMEEVEQKRIDEDLGNTKLPTLPELPGNNGAKTMMDIMRKQNEEREC